MASAINTVTKQYISRGIPYDADMGEDWIINPTQEQINSVLSPSLDEMKKQAEQAANAETRALILQGVEYPEGSGEYYQLGNEDQNNYNSMSEKKGRLPATIEITLVDGTFKEFDTSNLDAMTDAAFDYKMSLLAQNKIKRKAIRACTTIEELEAL